MRITPWIAAIALTAGLTPAVHAQYGQYDRYDPQHGNYDRGDWGYGNPATSWRADRVSALAHRIDETATYIHEQAERNNRRPDRDEERALAELHQLNDAAARFYERLEANGDNYYHTRRDFAQLINAYNQTVEALRYIAPRPYINRGMTRIASDMNSIGRYYGSNYGHLFISGRWSSRSGRYEHDRYDHDRNRDGYDRNHDRYDDGSDRPPVR
jgi:hypothetical protein